VSEARLYCARCGAPAPERRADEVFICRAPLPRHLGNHDGRAECLSRCFTTSANTRGRDEIQSVDRPRHPIDGEPDDPDPRRPWALTDKDKFFLMALKVTPA
jgi:hypothetical protein